MVLSLALYSDNQRVDMASHNMAQSAYQGPSVIKEICYGIGLSLMASFLWKMHHWKLQRRTKEFYDMLEKGEISVVVEDE
ncbi:putative cytochrome c oxidase subunit 5c-4 [Quercus suber]|uniref:Cytochrome c oxidase subunit 5c-4 n=1 Tax=Quercus suber TaxID=58331 RepID=A0AAW0JEW0_QUESU